MKDTKVKKKYLERQDYLEWRDLNNEIDKSERDLADKNRLLVYNDLRIRFHRSEAERNNLLATSIKSEDSTIKTEMEKDQSLIKNKTVKLEEFISELKEKKGVDLKDHSINPLTLELKPILPTSK